MFSSEQIFKVSGDFSQLEMAIDFAMKMWGARKDRQYYYQITEDGKYCIGWCEEDGWTPFQFDFDSHIVAEIVKQHLRKHRIEESAYDSFDGSTDDGFLMKAIEPSAMDEEGIKRPFFGIVSIEYFENFYAK